MKQTEDRDMSRMALTAGLVGLTIGSGCMTTVPPDVERAQRQKAAQQRENAAAAAAANAIAAKAIADFNVIMDPMDRGGGGAGGGGGGGGH